MNQESLPPRLKEASVITTLIAVCLVIVLYLANITLADTPDDVDIGDVETAHHLSRNGHHSLQQVWI